MTKLTALCVTSALILGSSSLAFAQNTANNSEVTAPAKVMQHAKGERGIFAGLDLTPQQRQQIRDIMQKTRQSQDGAERSAFDALHNLTVSEHFDEAKAKSQIDIIAKMRSERMLARAKAENNIYNLLTEKQKKQYLANYQNNKAKMMEHMRKMRMSHHNDEQ